MTYNYETHKNFGENFDYMYRYMYKLFMYPKDHESWLLDPKKEKSPTFCNFEIFDHDPQLDMKFWNP